MTLFIDQTIDLDQLCSSRYETTKLPKRLISSVHSHSLTHSLTQPLTHLFLTHSLTEIPPSVNLGDFYEHVSEDLI